MQITDDENPHLRPLSRNRAGSVTHHSPESEHIESYLDDKRLYAVCPALARTRRAPRGTSGGIRLLRSGSYDSAPAIRRLR
ncbi:hypothetical protein I6E29_02430 [Arcanobacterium haemolyticum]|nr:hypothetical protein [Arcanobacterium haemolyticum]